jgi:hypothetical protein
MDQLRGDKTSLERKLHDSEAELKSIDDSHRQIPLSFTRQSSINQTDDENSHFGQTLSPNKNNFDDDDDEGLSDTDSDVIQMKETLNQLKHISTTEKSTNVNPFLRSISYERPSNSSFIDSGRWSNTISSTMNNTYPLHQYQSTTSKNSYWQSQPSLITREAVLKAARDVLPPGVIDHLTSTH